MRSHVDVDDTMVTGESLCRRSGPLLLVSSALNRGEVGSPESSVDAARAEREAGSDAEPEEAVVEAVRAGEAGLAGAGEGLTK